MNERLSKIINHPLRIPVLTGVVSFGVGFGLGYILGRKTKNEVHAVPEQLKFNLNAKDMLALKDDSEKVNVAKFDDEEYDVDDDDIPLQDKVKLGEEFIAEKLKHSMSSKDESEPDSIALQTIFAATDDSWDLEVEVRSRSETQPYVLHKDEFYAEEMDYSQTTLTYYEGDDIMSDEEDHPVYNYSTVVGPLKFGHGSGDPNVFYVRNDKNRAEYEIVRDPGLFSVEVMGLEIEHNERARDIKHESQRKFRED